jgi:lipopolysaccharide export system permease protein
MLKTYQIYLINLFLKRVFFISLIFLGLIFILSIFEEISFFKDIEIGFYLPLLLTALSSPTALFEIFPFIFLISSQFFFITLIEKNELEILKVNGLNNIKIIKILFYISLFLGILIITIFYTFSSKLKFIYLDLKNNYSNDDKYLAVVTENGLWIKDEIDDKIYIINSSKINNNYLEGLIITQFDINFNLIEVMIASRADIRNFSWIIENPTTTRDNVKKSIEGNLILKTHFDEEKINSLFSNLSSLNILGLIKLGNDYKSLGYSDKTVQLQLHKIIAYPFYLTLMTLFAAVIMINLKSNKLIVFHIILGIFLSVLIYYFYYLFNLLGETEKIPLLASVWLPLLIMGLFILISLVRINEK